MGKHTYNIALPCAILLFTLLSCKTSSYNGVYKANSTGSLGSEIQLNKDGTFGYGIVTDVRGGGTFTGFWKSSKDTIYLDVINPVDLKNVIKEEKANVITNPLIQSGYSEIYIKVQDSIPFALAKVYADDILKPFVADANGKVLIKKENIDSLRIEFEYMTPRRFFISSGNFVEINIYDYEFVPVLYRMIFTKFLYQKNYLIPIDQKGKLLGNRLFSKIK